jgi:hypothetical protein
MVSNKQIAAAPGGDGCLSSNCIHKRALLLYSGNAFFVPDDTIFSIVFA